MRRKQNLPNALGCQMKIGGNHAFFPEIIKVQFRKISHTLLYILVFFRDIVALKHAWLPPIFFLDFNRPNAKICFSRIVIKSHKNTSVLVGTVLN